MTVDTTRPHPDGTHPSYSWTEAPRCFQLQPQDPAGLAAAMDNPTYPLSNAYCPQWVLQNSMGPIPIWLLEGLAPAMQFHPGQKVLDLGCGAAITSVFLAREYGVEVWAADLWIDPADNAARIDEAGLEGRVHPLHTEARQLPFDPGFFDAVVSIDAYHYFGTEVRYLAYLAQFVKEDGRLGVVCPANAHDPDDPGGIDLPPAMTAEYDADWFTFRSPTWWARHWSRSQTFAVELAEMVPGGREDWLRQARAVAAMHPGVAESLGSARLLECAASQTLGFARMVARRTGASPPSFGPGDFATRIA